MITLLVAHIFCISFCLSYFIIKNGEKDSVFTLPILRMCYWSALRVGMLRAGHHHDSGVSPQRKRGPGGAGVVLERFCDPQVHSCHQWPWHLSHRAKPCSWRFSQSLLGFAIHCLLFRGPKWKQACFRLPLCHSSLSWASVYCSAQKTTVRKADLVPRLQWRNDVTHYPINCLLLYQGISRKI